MWIRTIPVPSFETFTENGAKLVTPSRLGSFLQWREQLKTTEEYWGKILPFVDNAPFWEWSKAQVIHAFCLKMGVPDTGHCPQCQDTGRITIRNQQETWETWCLCHMVEWLHDQVVYSNMWGIDYPFASINSFDTERKGDPAITDQHRKLLRFAVSRAREYIKSPDHTLIFVGPTGVGKSHLLWAIARNLRPLARYTTGATLFQEIVDRMGYAGGANGRAMNQLIRAWEAPVPVFIDDFRAEHVKKDGATEAILLKILNQRMTNPQEYPTCMTMNVGEEDLTQDIMDRLGSRLSDLINETITMPVPSYRRSPERRVDYVHSRR